MAKRTAIIDIGSNSARLVIFERTSRYGFFIVCEQKSKVRIGEGAYEKEGFLQPIGLKRAYLALKSFLHTIQKYQTHKTLCIATSAIRDAPNGNLFISWIKKELGLSIKIIDGKKEARYGAIAATNLLPLQEGITIDIGGGSSDMALIKEGKILDTYSLNLGTVRLKELFFDKPVPIEIINNQAKEYIQKELQKLPKHFKHAFAIGIGGTARTLSKAIMKRSSHPLDKLHAFTYAIDDYRTYLEAIPLSSAKNLKRFLLDKDRYDTIREGTLIFKEILYAIEANSVISSGVGVREGVFLEHLLKNDHFRFPSTLNPSIVSILDRFQPFVASKRNRKSILKLGSKLFDTLKINLDQNDNYLTELLNALELSSIGNTLTIYKSHQHAFYIAMQELSYCFTHRQITLISLLLRMHGKELLLKPLYQNFKMLLPPKESLLWLSFIYTLTILLHEASNDAAIEFHYAAKVLTITSDKPLYLAKEKIKALEKPEPFAVIVKDENHIPKNKALNII